jgi:hypothetical protein
MAVVQHPSFPTQALEVPDDDVKKWTDEAGWKLVKKDDEAKVLEAAQRAQRTA